MTTLAKGSISVHVLRSTQALILPGWQNSDAVHWQTLWEKAFGYTRVQQLEWNHPKKSDWISNILQAVKLAPEPPVLICHSLGCAALAHLVHSQPNLPIRTAFLVAPPNLGAPNTPSEILDFYPIPLVRFAFPSLVVASANDPYCDLEHAGFLAKHWGSRLKNVGDHHHLGSQSNVGEWKVGQALLTALLLGN